MKPKQKMQEAYNIWVFTWMIWHNTKSGNIDYSKFPHDFSITSENGAVTFKVDIPLTETGKLAKNVLIESTGVCVTVFDSAMDEIFGKSEKNNPIQTTGLLAARVIVAQIRNAFAHDPINPKWCVGNQSHLRSFQISEIGLEINLNNFNGQGFHVSHINGINGLTKLLNYCLNNIKDD